MVLVLRFLPSIDQEILELLKTLGNNVQIRVNLIPKLSEPLTTNANHLKTDMAKT